MGAAELYQQMAAVALGDPAMQESIPHYRGGRLFATYTGVVARSQEIGSNEVDGDGVAIDTQHGERVRRSRFVYLSAAQAAAVRDGDTFLLDGEEWAYVRSLARDAGMAKLLAVAVEERLTRVTRLRHNGKPPG